MAAQPAAAVGAQAVTYQEELLLNLYDQGRTEAAIALLLGWSLTKVNAELIRLGRKVWQNGAES